MTLTTATCVILPILMLAATGEVSERKYFTAAVLEHRPAGFDEDGAQEVVSNFPYYKKAVEVAAEKGADLILFHEYALYELRERNLMRNLLEHVPDPKKEIFNPCNDKTGNLVILPFLSCLAKEHKIYVAANMGDIQSCESTCGAMENNTCQVRCPKDGVLMYNANVVFDREGNLVARYYKMYPYFEEFNMPEKPEYVTFNTVFGKFGLIICFDSVFKKSYLFAKDPNIHTILLPLWWCEDSLPFNPVEWQQSWAIANGVNILSANTNLAGDACIGSGIYTKKNGALVYTYEPDGESKLLVANVPLGNSSDVMINSSITIIRPDGIAPKVETGDIFPNQSYYKVAGPVNDRYLDFRTYRHQIENYTLAKLEKKMGTLQACNNNFCCNLKYAANTMKEDYYLGAISGLNNDKGFYHWCEESCLLLRCDPFQGKSCVIQPSRSNTVFKSVKMKASFNSQRVFPAVTTSKFRLAPKNEWKFHMKGQNATLSFTNQIKEPLLKVIMYGRCYDQDPEFIPPFQY